MITFQVSRVAQDIYAIIEVASTVLVYRTPKGETYGEGHILKPSDKIALLAFPDVEILLQEVFITPDA